MDGGVKKLELLSVFPDVLECHESVKTILDKLDVDAVEFSVSADIKICKLILKINNVNLDRYDLFQC